MPEYRKPFSRVALLTVLLTVAFGSWIYAAPEASDPDGNFHLTSIWCGSGIRQGICEQGLTSQGKALKGVVKVPEFVATAKNGILNPDSENFVFSRYHNFEGVFSVYPKGYYWFESKFVQPNVSQTVLRLRWINVLMFVMFFAFANRLLSHNLRMSFNLAQLVMLMPLGMFLIASNNPSSWAITGVGAYWAFLYEFLTSKSKGNRFLVGLLSIASACIASFSRADASMFVIAMSIVVVLVVHARKLVDNSKLLKDCKLLVLTLFPPLFSVYSSRQTAVISEGFTDPNGYVGRLPTSVFELDISRVIYNLSRLPGVFIGVFGLDGTPGELGWVDVPTPEIVFVGMFTLLTYLLLNFFEKRSKLELVSLSSLLACLCLVALKILHESGKVLPQFIQTRYFVPAVIALFGLYLSGSTLSSRIAESKSLRRLISTVLITSFAVSLHSTMQHYIQLPAELNWNLNERRVWWWDKETQPMTVWLLGSVAFAKLVFLLFLKPEVKTPNNLLRRIRSIGFSQLSRYLEKRKLSQLPDVNVSP